MIKKYSEEKRKAVIEARKAGLTIAQIAVQTGVGRSTKKAWLKDAGLTVNRKWKSDEIQTILKEYEECRSPKFLLMQFAVLKQNLLYREHIELHEYSPRYWFQLCRSGCR